ncbi:MAG: SPOR domain-containing protein [Acidobacteriaceae bacterium]
MKRYDESDDPKHSDTEITLGIKSILGIFFALALICGVFFGFGYSLGRGNGPKASTPQSAQHSAAIPAAPTPDIKTVVESASGSQTKPAAGEPVPPSLNAAATTASAIPAQTLPATQPTSAAAPPQAIPAAYSLPAKTSPAASASIMVQIAAVAHRQDADVLVTALGQRGYQASVRTEPGDQLLHVQIGPFATRNQAKAMQARLLNDGYNAILK